MVSSIGVEIFSSSEAVQTAEEGSSSRRSRATELALLVLKLDIKTQIGHGVVGVCGLAAFVAHDAAAQFAVEHLVEEAVAWFVIALHVSGCGGVQFIDKELEVFVGVLLTVSTHFL